MSAFTLRNFPVIPPHKNLRDKVSACKKARQKDKEYAFGLRTGSNGSIQSH